MVLGWILLVVALVLALSLALTLTRSVLEESRRTRRPKRTAPTPNAGPRRATRIVAEPTPGL